MFGSLQLWCFLHVTAVMFRLFYSRDELTFYNLDETNLPPTCRWWFKVCLEIIVNKIFMALESWNQRSRLWEGGVTLILHNVKRIKWIWFTVESGQTMILPVKDVEFFWNTTLSFLFNYFQDDIIFLTGFYQENLTFFIRYFAKNVMFWTKFFWEKTWYFERYFDKNSRCVQYDI